MGGRNGKEVENQLRTAEGSVSEHWAPVGGGGGRRGAGRDAHLSDARRDHRGTGEGGKVLLLLMNSESMFVGDEGGGEGEGEEQVEMLTYLMPGGITEGQGRVEKCCCSS